MRALLTSLLLLLLATPASAQITRYSANLAGSGCTRDSTTTNIGLPACSPIGVDETTYQNTATLPIVGHTGGPIRVYVNAFDDTITCIAASGFVSADGVTWKAVSRMWLMQEANATQAPGVHITLDVPYLWYFRLDVHASKCAGSVHVIDIYVGYFD